jgi:hypothetical protein
MLTRTSLKAAILITVVIETGQATANENVVGRPTPGPASVAPANEKSRFPIIDNPRDLPPTLKKALGVKDDGTPDPAAAGNAGHPFTTMEASAVGEMTPVDKSPWRATGKILMTFADGSYVCSGSVIGKGLVVTAAHCVHNFGKQAAGFAHSISFEPARHADKRPYGTWRAKEWWIPKAYHDGTDKCQIKGVVCENDVAVINTPSNPIRGDILTYSARSRDISHNSDTRRRTMTVPECCARIRSDIGMIRPT